MNSKVRNIILLVLVVLVVLSSIIVTVKLSKKSNKKENDVQVYVYNEKGNNNTENIDEKNKEKDDEKKEIKQSKIKISMNKKNNWYDEGMYYTQIEVTLRNNSDKRVEDILLKFDFKDEYNLVQNWNFTYTKHNQVLTVKLMEYNKYIEPNNEIQIGMVVSSKNVDVFSQIESKLFLEGEEMLFEEDRTEDTVLDHKDNVETGITKEDKTPLETHGKLSVVGTKIKDKNSNDFVLKGISTHGISWFGEYVNYDTFKSLRDFFGANTVRLAMYSDKNAGYKVSLHEKVKKGVKHATDLGMYVIIDWHILKDNNPNINKEEAKAFFTEMSGLYKDNVNVIYEICNEPNGDVTWERDILPYAEEIISVIRKNDSDAIIIVGTPNYSQDVDVVSKNPIKNQKNIMYALHFYSATHKEELINKARTALKAGLPLFVSEFGITDASGNGNIDKVSASNWMQFLKEEKISYMFWNLSNKNEASAVIKESVKKTNNFILSDLTVSGAWIKEELEK